VKNQYAQYFKQVNLLLRILPLIARENDIAIHGGTAINLFYFDMPRLSVDIDLTYLPFADREKDLKGIENILLRLKDTLYKSISQIQIVGPNTIGDEYKLYCSYGGNEVKIEVNTINRGVFRPTKIIGLCAQAQEQFNVFCEAQIVPMPQLFGSKIVAALDRQHPRDIFDVKNILEVFGLSNGYFGDVDPHFGDVDPSHKKWFKELKT